MVMITDSDGFTIVRLCGRPRLQVRVERRPETVSGILAHRCDWEQRCAGRQTGRMIERWVGGHF